MAQQIRFQCFNLRSGPCEEGPPCELRPELYRCHAIPRRRQDSPKIRGPFRKADYAQGAAKGKRCYRYYVSRDLVRGSADRVPGGWRVAAPELERAVVAAASNLLNDKAARRRLRTDKCSIRIECIAIPLAGGGGRALFGSFETAQPSQHSQCGDPPSTVGIIQSVNFNDSAAIVRIQNNKRLSIKISDQTHLFICLPWAKRLISSEAR
jgi:hypothetical protein